MKHYDFGHDPSVHWIEGKTAPKTDITKDELQELIATRAKATPDAVGDLTFVTTLLDRLEALHKEDPDADVSLSVAGAWTASFESVVVAEDDDLQDDAA